MVQIEVEAPGYTKSIAQFFQVFHAVAAIRKLVRYGGHMKLIFGLGLTLFVSQAVMANPCPNNDCGAITQYTITANPTSLVFYTGHSLTSLIDKIVFAVFQNSSDNKLHYVPLNVDVKDSNDFVLNQCRKEQIAASAAHKKLTIVANPQSDARLFCSVSTEDTDASDAVKTNLVDWDKASYSKFQ